MIQYQSISPNFYELFGISTLLFRELSLENALEYLKSTNIKFIDLTIVPNYCPHYDLLESNQKDDKQLAKIFDKNGIKVASLNVSPGYYNKNESVYVDKILIRAAQLANELRTNIITIPSGAKVVPEKWIEDVNKVAGHINKIAEIINKDYGIILSIETPHLKTLTETLDQAIKFHEILNSSLIKYTIDTSHMAALGENDVSRSLEKIGIEKINHIHLRDVRKREITFTPGKGSIDFKDIYRVLKTNKYKGKLIFELEYNDYPIKQKMKEVQFVISYFNEIISLNKIPFKFKVKTNSLYLFFERFFNDPVLEIKRHDRLFNLLRKYKKLIFTLIPEKVFKGNWEKTYRFRKNKCVVHKKGSKTISGSTKTTKVGIIGLGYAGGKMHAGGFNRLKNCQIIGGVDVDQEKRDVFKKKYKCNVFKSFEEMISNDKPDVVSICTREWLHYDAAIYCLQNGVDVFCEKIMATRLTDAIKMVEVAKKNNRVLGINYNYRFIPAIRKIKEIIEHKALGRLAYFVINVHAFSYAHALDLLSFLGGRIRTVTANNQNDPAKRNFARTDWSHYDENIQYVPSTSTNVVVEFAGGAKGIVNSSIFYPLHSYIMTIEAVFEEGIVNFTGMNMFDIRGRLSWYSKRPVKAVDMNYRKDMYANGYELTFYNSIESFIGNYLEGKKPETPGEQGLFNMKLETLIDNSSKKGVTIELL